MKLTTEGTTRLVFIFEKIVIKIPWINFCKVIETYLKYKNEGTADIKIKRFCRIKSLAIFPYALYLLNSNRREYLYFKSNFNEKTLLPLRGLLYGYIIIQPRVEVLVVSNFRWSKLHLSLLDKGVENVDLLKARNYCIHDEKIKLLDYGSNLTQETLNSMGFEILTE